MNNTTTNAVTIYLLKVLNHKDLKPFQSGSWVLTIPQDKCSIHAHGISVEVNPLQHFHIPYHNIRFFLEDVPKTQPTEPKKETNKKKK